jgi:hypothetical protein
MEILEFKLKNVLLYNYQKIKIINNLHGGHVLIDKLLSVMNYSYNIILSTELKSSNEIIQSSNQTTYYNNSNEFKFILDQYEKYLDLPKSSKPYILIIDSCSSIDKISNIDQQLVYINKLYAKPTQPLILNYDIDNHLEFNQLNNFIFIFTDIKEEKVLLAIYNNYISSIVESYDDFIHLYNKYPCLVIQNKTNSSNPNNNKLYHFPIRNDIKISI